jgi:hypothetical protein
MFEMSLVQAFPSFSRATDSLLFALPHPEQASAGPTLLRELGIWGISACSLTAAEDWHSRHTGHPSYIRERARCAWRLTPEGSTSTHLGWSVGPVGKSCAERHVVILRRLIIHRLLLHLSLR